MCYNVWFIVRICHYCVVISDSSVIIYDYQWLFAIIWDYWINICDYLWLSVINEWLPVICHYCLTIFNYLSLWLLGIIYDYFFIFRSISVIIVIMCELWSVIIVWLSLNICHYLWLSAIIEWLTVIVWSGVTICYYPWL